MEVILKSGEFGTQIKVQDPIDKTFKQIHLQIKSFRASQLKQLVEKEFGIQNFIIIDEKGIEITSMHPDELICSDSKKLQHVFKNLVNHLFQVFYVFNDALKSDLDIRKVFEDKYSQDVDLKNITINNGLIDHDIEERYNFKPIYAASSYIQGLDLTSIQNYEQTFFNDYTLLKQAYKKFKHRKSQGFKILNEVEQQFLSLDYLKKSVYKTLESININRSSIKKKFVEQYEKNQKILDGYQDGIQELKKYEVHPALKKEGKQYLMDFYYDEAQMHKWRDSCIRSQESLKGKIEKFDKEVHNMRSKYASSSQISGDEQKSKDLFKKLESFASEKEPLIISLISTVYESLKQVHKYLNTFCASDPQPEEIKQAQQFFLNVEQLKKQMKEHQDLSQEMEEHSKELDIMIEDIKSLQYKNALFIMNCAQQQGLARKDLKQNGATLEYTKYLHDCVQRIEKDFGYLQHPSQLPRAYEKALFEVQRRKKFRKVVDEEYGRLKKLIQTEKDKRNVFITEYGKLLPSDFIPQLRDSVLSIRMEGGSKDYDLPDIDDSNIDDYDDFKHIYSSSEQDKQSNPDNESQKKCKDLINEINLLKEEHKSNLKDLTNKVQELEYTLRLRNDKISEIQKNMLLKDQEISKSKQENEKLMKSLKDTSLSFTIAQKMNEETIARKTKEVESLLKEKKCKNCILCLEDLKDKQGDILITDLNERLMIKTKKIDQLEDQLRKNANLINQVCSHNFQFLRTKTSDFYKSLEQIKSSYENRLMEVEEKLTLEQKRCETVIKTRVAALEEKYLKSKSKESELHKKMKEMQLQKESDSKEIKLYQNKSKEYQQQAMKMNQENSKLLQDRKAIEEEHQKAIQNLDLQLKEDKDKIKDLQDKLIDERQKAEEQQKKEIRHQNEQMSQYENEIKVKNDSISNLKKLIETITEEKIKLEEKIKKENALLTKQLNELKEQLEKEIREKNENILRLNNLLNEHFDKSQQEAADHKALEIQEEKFKKEMGLRNKELQDITLCLSKRDQTINQIKKENEFLIGENQKLKSQIKDLETQVIETKGQLQSSSSSNEQVEMMRQQLKSMQLECKQKTIQSKENESMIQRIKELACTTLNLSNLDSWESGLTRALTANSVEHINFLRAVEGVRVLFMPHSPGVYIALVLKQIEDIEQDQTLKQKDLNGTDSLYLMKSESGHSVKRIIIKNNLFLDIESLSKNLQTILNTYQMIVIARIKSVTKHQVNEEQNPFGLDLKETFFLCQIEKLEHIVGFEGDEYSFTDYACR